MLNFINKKLFQNIPNIPKIYFLFILILLFCSIIIFLSVEGFSLVSVESALNSLNYKVQDRHDKKEAANFMSKIKKNIDSIDKLLFEKYPQDERVIRMNKRLKKTRLQETISKPDESSYTINKGQIMSFCLRHKNDKKKETDKFHRENVLIFVIIHELAHVMSITEGHGKEFMDNFRFILRECVKAGIYNPVDYSKLPMNYCGVEVTHNPYYNHV